MRGEIFFSCDGILWFMSSWDEAVTHGAPRSCLALGGGFELTFWFSRKYIRCILYGSDTLLNILVFELKLCKYEYIFFYMRQLMTDQSNR